MVRWTACLHWVQSKRHRLWFSTKTCSCYLTKTYVDSLILSSNWIWLRWETNTLKCVWCSTKTTCTFNVYVSRRSQIQFEDEDHAVYMSFRLVTNTLSSLRTTTCDALIVPSAYDCTCWQLFQRRYSCVQYNGTVDEHLIYTHYTRYTFGCRFSAPRTAARLVKWPNSFRASSRKCSPRQTTSASRVRILAVKPYIFINVHGQCQSNVLVIWLSCDYLTR